jgi:peptidoglycan/xylan/chitin deacetylase (PgdA/CDA1 family)
MADPVVEILMYHSISEGVHPTQIAPGVFAEQMAAIADLGVPVLTLDDFCAARSGERTLPPRSVIITFDDALTDFAEVAWPILKKHGFPAINYVPTGRVGETADWTGAALPPARIMDWETLGALAAEGATFGSHSVTHPILNALAPEVVADELCLSRDALEDRLGKPARHFAPPYGRATPSVQRLIGEYYRSSVGTRLDSATLLSPGLDFPRLEMYYFRDVGVWRRHLRGRGRHYLALRRTLRLAKQASTFGSVRG